MAARLTLLGLHPIFLKLPQADLVLDRDRKQRFLARQQGIEVRSYSAVVGVTHVLAHLGVRVCDEIADDLFGRRQPYIARWSTYKARTWSAVIPFVSAFFTLSRVMAPTTRFGKRDLSVTNRFRTAICRGLSMFS